MCANEANFTLAKLRPTINDERYDLDKLDHGDYQPVATGSYPADEENRPRVWLR